MTVFEGLPWSVLFPYPAQTYAHYQADCNWVYKFYYTIAGVGYGNILSPSSGYLDICAMRDFMRQDRDMTLCREWMFTRSSSHIPVS